MTTVHPPWRIAPPLLAAAIALCACGAPPRSTTDATADDATDLPAGDAREPPSAEDGTGVPPSPAEDAAPPPQATPLPAPPAVQRPVRPPTATPPPPAPPAAADPGDAQPPTLVINMLSRGKGVPDATRAAFQDIRALLSAYSSDLQVQRIGLEGETRLCAEFSSARDAEAALAEIRARAAGIDLLEIAEGPCPPSKEAKP